MALNVRQKLADMLVRMLRFNVSPPSINGRHDEDTYKVLVLDRLTKDILAPLLHVNELRRHGVTLHLLLDSHREPIPDVAAVYFVQPTQEAIDRIASDAQSGLYAALHLNFSTQLPRPLMERLASAVVAGNAAARIAHVFDQHAQFIALESDLFSLGMPMTYLDLNDPQAPDTAIEAAVGQVVEGIFCVLATLGVVPLIRCPPGGVAEHVAARLDARLRDALRGRANLFAEAASGGGLVSSLQRPLLCLFDRNFELSVVLQHAWTYKPLTHDLLDLKLNRIALPETSQPTSAVPMKSGHSKAYEIDDGDFFWKEHGREQFPRIAEQVEAELARYKAAVEDLNRATGANVDPSADLNDVMSASTRGLMSAVSSLPQLTERKRVIDKHTNIATSLLSAIKSRGLDKFYQLEEELVTGKADLTAVALMLNGGQGTAADMLRLALVWMLTSPTVPSEADCTSLEGPLVASDADMAAWSYVKRMRRMNLTGKAPSVAGSSAEALTGLGGAPSHLSTLLGSTFGQGLSSLTKGVKNLLAGEQQAAVTVAVEALMDGRPIPETDAYLTFDPRSPAGRAQRPAGGYKESIVFMVGGGNYLEAESLACWAQRAGKHVVYGATELLTGEDMLRQLAELGRRSGAAPR